MPHVIGVDTPPSNQRCSILGPTVNSKFPGPCKKNLVHIFMIKIHLASLHPGDIDDCFPIAHLGWSTLSDP